MEDKTVVIIIAIIIIIFIITREFFCWYFKITEISNNLESIASAISRAKLGELSNTKEIYLENSYLNKDELIALQNSITILKEKNTDIEIKNDNLVYAVEQLKNDYENINFETEIEKILTKEREYSLNRVYDERNNLIGHEWIQVVEKGHWVSMIFDEKNRKFTNVKHYRTHDNHNKYQNKDTIVHNEQIFNAENVFGFKDRKILNKEGKFYRWK